jgi:hypothetical protein
VSEQYDELAGHSGLKNEGMVEMVCYWYDHPQEEEGVPGVSKSSIGKRDRDWANE